MAKIINTKGLPEPIFELVSKDDYTKGDAAISVTELIDSPRIRVLKKKHDHEIVIEAEDLLASNLGKAFHSAVEKATKTGVAERRLFIEVNGWMLSGGMDHYHDGVEAYEGGVLTDYKITNVWKCVYGEKGRIDSFEKQLNVYAQILRQHSYPVKELKIFAYFKDWNKRNQREIKKAWKPWEESGYPAKQWAYFNVPLWEEEVAKIYIQNRIKLHQQAEKELPNCRADEIWNGTRCGSYCSVSQWCEQYKQIKTTGISEGKK